MRYYILETYIDLMGGKKSDLVTPEQIHDLVGKDETSMFGFIRRQVIIYEYARMSLNALSERPDARELLAKLTCRAMRMERSSCAHGLLTNVEIAGMLSGLPRTAQLFALYRYCGDGSVRNELFYHAYLQAATVAGQCKWDIPRGIGIVKALARLGMMESIDLPLCKRCLGRQFIFFEAKIVECPTCRGTGRLVMSNRDRFEYAGLNRGMWYRKWMDRYDLILRQLVIWSVDLDNIVVAKLQSELRGLTSGAIDK